MFFSLKLKAIIPILLLVLITFLLSYGVVFCVKYAGGSASVLKYTIVLDAGHGGMDGGSVGVSSGAKESEINLKVVKKLEHYLKRFGFNVVLTRSDENGLYEKFNSEYKLVDMQKRREIIKKARANMVVSVHMNSFTDSSFKGSQVFYDDFLQTGKELAEIIQNEFVNNLENAKKSTNLGDYYILKSTTNPSVLIECGYLSNPDEDILLQSEAYQEKLAYYTFSGIVKYFQNVNGYLN